MALEPIALSAAYDQFFNKTEAGKAFMDMLHSLEANHVTKAQKDKDINELSMSAGNKEVVTHITTVIAQVAGQLQK